jgi:CheY-like chemotaxis protein
MAHKLLLADDSITIQRVIELTFADEDVQVFAVGDGKHAIDRIQADRPDIVLADVGMPERDGYEVAAFVRSQPHLAHIPVLLLTGAFEPIDEKRARAVGCDGVLVKPFEPQMVINRVKDLLAGRKSGGHTESTTAESHAAPDVDPLATQTPDAKAGDSLEDYFDRLDAAFATLNGDTSSSAAPAASAAHVTAVPGTGAVAAAPSRPATAEDFASWDPDLAVEERRPAAIPASREPEPGFTAIPPAAPLTIALAPVVDAPKPAPAEVSPSAPAAPAVVSPQPASAAAHVAAPQFSLAEAFATLLSAEHGYDVITPRPRAVAAAAPPTPEIVEDIVRQVLDRLQNEDMRQRVIDVAERLVREEIDRIKRSNA